jgi:hypothetical protein
LQHASVIVSGSGAADGLYPVEERPLVGPDPDTAPPREVCERNLFHRPPMQVTCEGTVVDDSAAAHVDAVVCEAKTRCNEVCAQLRFLVFGQKPVASMKSTAIADSAR